MVASLIDASWGTIGETLSKKQTEDIYAFQSPESQGRKDTHLQQVKT